jgi:hypothetical protein
MSSTIDIVVRLVHLIAAGKQQFSCQCARKDWNTCVLSLSATFLLPQQKSCQCARYHIKQCSTSEQLKLPVRALSYKAVFYIRATEVASARLAYVRRATPPTPRLHGLVGNNSGFDFKLKGYKKHATSIQVQPTANIS